MATSSKKKPRGKAPQSTALRSNHRSAARVVHIIERLRQSPEGCYCEELAEDVGVSRRTLSRYVLAIRAGLQSSRSGARVVQYHDGEGAVLQLLGRGQSGKFSG